MYQTHQTSFTLLGRTRSMHCLMMQKWDINIEEWSYEEDKECLYEMLTLTDLATVPRRGFCKGEGGDLHNWRIKPLIKPISIQIQFENSAKNCQELIWFDFYQWAFHLLVFHSVTCSCTPLWTHWPGQEAGVHSFRSFIWKWRDPSCKEQNALLSCKPMSKLFPFQLSTTIFFQKLSGDDLIWVL
jgi:hypothetical protein